MSFRRVLLPLLAATCVAAGAEAQQAILTGYRLTPSSTGPELTIEAIGAMRFSSFTLQDPERIVIDLEGASESTARSHYSVERGGIASVRSSEQVAGVVRVVVHLDHPAAHSVSVVPEGILVRVDNGRTTFAEWNTAPTAVARYASAESEGAGTRGTLSTAPRREEQRISVNFHNTDIRDVLASFAEFTGRSIVPGSGVTGQVTATIRDQPWDVALQTILRAYGLAAQELSSGIIQVDSIERIQERQTQEPLVTRPFRINYVPAAELASSLDPLSSERGRISVNPSTNTVIVTDTEAVLNEMQRILAQLDVRTPQVAIQAKIIFVNRTDVEELGVTYDLALNPTSGGGSASEFGGSTSLVAADVVRLGGSSLASLGNAQVKLETTQLKSVLSLVLGRHTLLSFIDALQSRELSDVQAAPLITTLDNQPAEIWVGERTPIRVVDVGTGTAGGAGGPRATAELVETGIRLRVTPTITADRRILMQLHAERSSAQLAATDIGVVFQQQQGTTRLMVEDGETAVIGGLTVSEVASTRTGIPILMDIPVIGALFRTNRTREQKRDLLIMVTPRIVEERI
jgi:type IV pilus assembly protein PilQ